MFLCKYDLLSECDGKYKDCVDCILDKIRYELVELQKDYQEYGWAYDDALAIIDKYKA